MAPRGYHPPQLPYHYMRQVGTIYSPSNGTPHLAWQRHDGLTDFVALSPLDESRFGLVSVDLGNPFGLSLQPSIDISFIGFKTDGSVISQTFTTPFNDFANFTTFHFGTEFASGLTRVEIPSQYWAMDNLVWVPEPSTYALLSLGLLALGLSRFKRLQKK
jgi:hypothetical protein